MRVRLEPGEILWYFSAMEFSGQPRSQDPITNYSATCGSLFRLFSRGSTTFPSTICACEIVEVVERSSAAASQADDITLLLSYRAAAKSASAYCGLESGRDSKTMLQGINSIDGNCKKIGSIRNPCRVSHGAQKIVYRSKDPAMDRVVALKTITSVLLAMIIGMETRERFFR